jgi:hypothetical protein
LGLGTVTGDRAASGDDRAPPLRSRPQTHGVTRSATRHRPARRLRSDLGAANAPSRERASANARAARLCDTTVDACGEIRLLTSRSWR